MGLGDDGRVECVPDFQALGMNGLWCRQNRSRPCEERGDGHPAGQSTR